MATDYLGAIKIFAGTYAPRGYALTAGQLLAIQQNTALFSLLGTYYGGNGVATFALPDLRGRLPLSQGQGQGLTPRVVGEIGGVENVTLLSSNAPTHNHVFNGSTTAATTNVAGPTALLGAAATGTNFYATQGGTDVLPKQLNPNVVSPQGGNLPHNNIQPSFALTYIIALSGVFPSRS
jgi:microcystin-dependent protein